MPLWVLDPINIGHAYWRASCYKRRVIVRAETSGRARGIAATEFETEPAEADRLGDLLSPWLTPSLVKVGRAAPSVYAEVGLEGIVELDDREKWRSAGPGRSRRRRR
jgi:hypothetical protein